MDVERKFAESANDFARLIARDFAAAQFLPNGISKLGSDQIRSKKDNVGIEQTRGRRGVNLGNEPFDGDTRIDNKTPHRRRSSPMRVTLSECFRSLSFRRMRAATVRLSMMSVAAARSTIICSSA